MKNFYDIFLQIEILAVTKNHSRHFMFAVTTRQFTLQKSIDVRWGKLNRTGIRVTARTTIFSFYKCSEKMIFLKKSHWNMIFLASSGKMILFFPENKILFFKQKMKDDLSQKKYLEIWYVLQMFRKDGLSKKNCTGI